MSSEFNDLNTIVHKGENFATTVAKVGDDSFSEDVSLQTKVPTVVLVDTKNLILRRRKVHEVMSFCLTNVLNGIHRILWFLFLAKVSFS